MGTARADRQWHTHTQNRTPQYNNPTTLWGSFSLSLPPSLSLTHTLTHTHTQQHTHTHPTHSTPIHTTHSAHIHTHTHIPHTLKQTHTISLSPSLSPALSPLSLAIFLPPSLLSL